MSSSTYTSYRVSAAEQRRLERERKKRLEEERRRREEERKREEERQRKQRIAEEQVRVELSLKFKEQMLELQRKNAIARLQRLQKFIQEFSANPQKKQQLLESANQLLQQLSTTNSDQLPDLSEKIRQLETEAKSSGNISAAVDTTATTRREMEDTLDLIRAQLENVPEDLRLICAAELRQVEQTVTQIEKALAAGSATHLYHSLKWAQRDLVQLLSDAEARRKEWESGLVQCHQLIEQLIVDLTVVRERAFLEDQRRNANTLITALEFLHAEKNLDILQKRLGDYQKQANRLIAEFEELLKRADEREFALKTIEEVLYDMGYEVLSMPESGPSEAAAPLFVQFKTPTGEVVKLGFGLDNSIYSEFAHLVHEGEMTSADRDTLIAKCETWCQDYDALLARLQSLGLELDEKWRVAPDDGKFTAIRVKARASSESVKRKGARRRKSETKRRTL